MISTIKALLKKLGIDKAIAYSSGARIVQAFTGVGSIFFISTFLSGVEQGFYYTFGSLVAIDTNGQVLYLSVCFTYQRKQYSQIANTATNSTVPNTINFPNANTNKFRL